MIRAGGGPQKAANSPHYREGVVGIKFGWTESLPLWDQRDTTYCIEGRTAKRAVRNFNATMQGKADLIGVNEWMGDSC